MSSNSLLRAVLNKPQQKAFQKEFNIDPNALTPIVSGYWKYVLLSKDEAYLFHRNHVYAKLAENEKYIYEWLLSVDNVPAPKLKDVVLNEDISPYEIVVVDRLNGMVLSEIYESFNYGELTNLCVELSEYISIWHSKNVKDLPIDYITKTQSCCVDELNNINWLLKLFMISEESNALKFLELELKRYFSDKEVNKLIKIFIEKFNQIKSLDKVLVHQDLHEAQIMISEEKPCKITGILDWESARLLNPIIEFNFNEWWKPVWIKDISKFQKIRAKMWENYAKNRKLDISSDDVVLIYNFYYLLQINDWKEKLDNKDIYENAIKYVLNELNRIINNEHK